MSNVTRSARDRRSTSRRLDDYEKGTSIPYPDGADLTRRYYVDAAFVNVGDVVTMRLVSPGAVLAKKRAALP